MLQAAREYVGQDLHVPVAMGAKALSGGHPVLVDHAQRSKAHMFGIVIARKGEGMVRIQPAMIGMATFISAAESQHRVLGCVAELIPPSPLNMGPLSPEVTASVTVIRGQGGKPLAWPYLPDTAQQQQHQDQRRRQLPEGMFEKRKMIEMKSRM